MNAKAGEYQARRVRGRALPAAGAAALALVFLFSSIYVLQAAALFLLLILLGSKAYSEYLIRNISLRRRNRELRVFRHEWVQVELLAENQGRLPALTLALSDSPGGIAVFRDNKTLRSLRARGRTVFVWRAFCAMRGVFTLGPASFRGSDPLGLFPFQFTGHETVTLFVYPAAGSVFLRNPGGIPLGTLISPNPLYEDMTRRRSLRTYHPGDEPRRINWRATAQSGEMMVNEYEPTLSYPLAVFLNACPSAYPLKKREPHLERAIEAAAALCLMASRERQPLGIIIYSPGLREPLTFIKPSSQALIPILERLAGLERSGDGNGGDTGTGLNTGLGLSGAAAAMHTWGSRLPYGTRLIYTGPELTGEEYLALEGLARRHLSLEYLIIDERTLPVMGNYRRYQIKESGHGIL